MSDQTLDSSKPAGNAEGEKSFTYEEMLAKEFGQYPGKAFGWNRYMGMTARGDVEVLHEMDIIRNWWRQNAEGVAKDAMKALSKGAALKQS